LAGLAEGGWKPRVNCDVLPVLLLLDWRIGGLARVD
jgi:hypothetical protein